MRAFVGRYYVLIICLLFCVSACSVYVAVVKTLNYNVLMNVCNANEKSLQKLISDEIKLLKRQQDYIEVSESVQKMDSLNHLIIDKDEKIKLLINSNNDLLANIRAINRLVGQPQRSSATGQK